MLYICKKHIVEAVKYIYSPASDECKSIFVASCIESVANSQHTPSFEIYKKMRCLGMIDEYILPYYEVLHTESRQNLTQDLIHTMRVWSSKKGICI